MSGPGQAAPAKIPHHPNFLGIPTREDIQTLEQLRRQLMPMIGVLDKLYNDMMHALNHGEAVNWPHIRHNISTINSYLTSLNKYMNGTYKHSEESVKSGDGKKQVVYNDKAIEGQAPRIGALHVYPQAPYPMADERLSGMALVLLEKRLGNSEEKWVEERLRKAAEFARVPGEWEIEPRKPAAVMGEEDSEDDEDMKGWDEGIPTTRVKCNLSEDEILDVWTNGHKTAFNKEFWGQMRFGLGEEGEEGEEGKEGEVGSEQDQDMEDGDEEEGEEEEEDDAESPKAPPPPPVVMIQRAAPAVHKAVPGAPVMALGVVHRFMASGEVQQPAGPR